MRVFRSPVLIAVCVLTAATTLAQTKLDSLLVFGDGFRFTVKEPSGWRADIENASRLEANVIFYRPGESPDDARALIRVRVNSKTDENIAADLQDDMNGYRQKEAAVQFRDFKVAHPAYPLVSKLFFVPGKFFEYVVYINPGVGKAWTFAASMNKGNEATVAELEAFREVIRSLILL
jgi:hypothetical protein